MVSLTEWNVQNMALTVGAGDASHGIIANIVVNVIQGDKCSVFLSKQKDYFFEFPR